MKTNAALIPVLLGLALGLAARPRPAQTVEPDRETDPAVLRKLEWFKDAKFGLMMHWGPYSQWGVVESWSICSEDEPWCRRSMPNYVEYKKAYENLPRTFNPTKFDPAKWAAAAKAAGMRYVVMTTKHHDGFTMYDTKQTDYRITGPGVPFRTNARADVFRAVVDAFRAQGFGIGAYFSKPDWHHPDFWAPEWATPDRNVNYSIDRYPERWQRFRDFTFRQIEELVTGYGPLDILWLDGGWVRPQPMIEVAPGTFVHNPKNMDIDMPRIAAMARSRQPGLLVVDRTVTGRYENYRTPEQEVPDKPLPYPWETCMTMGTSWSYRPTDAYKPPHRLIHLLVDIVSKGGNLLLNIGPSPDGEFAPEALDRLQAIGEWMAVNGRAIHGTRPFAPFKEAKTCFTSLPDGRVFAIYLADEDESAPPAKLMLFSITPRVGTEVRMLGVAGPVRWERAGKGVLLTLPERAVKAPPCRHAWVFELRPAPARG
ncbi:MAG TPA: alpha-L-fucosidase [Terriglobales bacterium]|nr:alpha-L-fucosidase [Terriglobales bacterium]